jgi:hypothetical protein
MSNLTFTHYYCQVVTHSNIQAHRDTQAGAGVYACLVFVCVYVRLVGLSCSRVGTHTLSSVLRRQSVCVLMSAYSA